MLVLGALHQPRDHHHPPLLLPQAGLQVRPEQREEFIFRGPHQLPVKRAVQLNVLVHRAVAALGLLHNALELQKIHVRHAVDGKADGRPLNDQARVQILGHREPIQAEHLAHHPAGPLQARLLCRRPRRIPVAHIRAASVPGVNRADLLQLFERLPQGAAAHMVFLRQGIFRGQAPAHLKFPRRNGVHQLLGHHLAPAGLSGGFRVSHGRFLSAPAACVPGPVLLFYYKSCRGSLQAARRLWPGSKKAGGAFRLPFCVCRAGPQSSAQSCRNASTALCAAAERVVVSDIK